LIRASDFVQLEQRNKADFGEHGIIEKYLHKNDASTEHFSF